MKTIEEIANVQLETMTEQQAYDEIINMLKESKDNEIPIDEGIFKALAGGIVGATFGPAVMKGICKVLGITETGPLGNLMTSRLIITALSAYMGWKN